jgi:transcriptional antiterminator RfaH
VSIFLTQLETNPSLPSHRPWPYSYGKRGLVTERAAIPLDGRAGWYTVQTKPRKEGETEKGLRALNLEVFLPRLRCRRRVGSRHQWVLGPLFPCYLFCRLDLAVSAKAVRYTPGVKDFVKFGGYIPEVRRETIHAVMERCSNGVVEIKPPPLTPGQRVVINEGTLSGLEAVFERELNQGQRVRVLIEFLGSANKLTLSRELICQA